MEGSICKYSLMNSFIHSFLAWFCSLQLKLLTNDQIDLFIRGDSKGPGAMSTYPYVTNIRDGKFEATFGENWKRR
jgi:formylmethanofuran dehydrogenase subunit A